MDEIFIKWLNIYDEFREGSALRDIYQADIINIGMKKGSGDRYLSHPY